MKPNKDRVRQHSITVLICAYNAEKTIGAQLEALEPQVNGLDAELIVVNNRSTDNTKRVVGSFTSRIPSLRCIEANNHQGKPHAINVGVDNAHSDYIAMTDADDAVSDEWLVSHIKNLAPYNLTTGPICTTSLNPKLTRGQPNWGQEPQLGFLPFMSGSNQGFSRKLFYAVGGMDEKMLIGEDIALSWRMQLAGGKIIFLDRATVNVRYREDSTDDWLQTLSFAKAHSHLFKLFQKHGMPRSSSSEVGNRLRRAAIGLRYYRGLAPSERHQVKRQIAIILGHILGSIQYRVLYL